MQEESQLFGIDWNGPITHDEDDVIVPETFCPLMDDHDVEELTNTILPSAPSINHGIDLYLATLSFIENKI